MGQTYDSIPDEFIQWILKQEMFWVATAPLSGDGHVNLSPKGVQGSFNVVSPNRVWYQDLTGSGVETISHLGENGRITILFNAFEGPARILRLFGKGTVHEFGTREYGELVPLERRRPGSRAAIVIDIHRASTSCGWGVPRYDFKEHRRTLVGWCAGLEGRDRAATGSEQGIKSYWRRANTMSIDGLPGLRIATSAHATPVSGRIDVEPTSTGKKISESVAAKNTAGSGEHIRLLVAFVLGLLVAAVYTQMQGAIINYRR